MTVSTGPGSGPAAVKKTMPTTAPTAGARAWLRRNYFVAASGALLFLTVWGFSDNLFWRMDQPSNRDPKFIFHGGFCLAWMVILFVQALLVRRRRVRVHRALGKVGAVVALGVTVSTVWVFVAVWKGWQAMPNLVQANRLLLPSFTLFVAWAIWRRRRADWHRRLMLVASFFMLEPVLSRSFDPVEPLLLRFTDAQVDSAWWVVFVAVWTGLFASLWAHDLLVERRLHRATALGTAWFVAIWLVVAVV